MEVSKKKLINGAVYSGEIQDGMPHGRGTYETDDLIYDGYFKHGMFDGLATLTDKKAHYKYTGEFKEGNRIGFGKVIFDDGKYFEGMFTNNKANGIGYMEYSDGEVYIGEFRNNLANGRGTVYYTNGNIFTGLFKDDKEDGIGVMMEAGNRAYGIKVEYSNGYTMIHGQVKLTTEINVHMVYRLIENDNFRYFGMIDKYSNYVEGIYHYDKDSNFDTFIGSFNCEFKTGVVYFKNGDKFEGFYENDELTGKGSYTIFGKGTYIGEFINGKKCGDFTFIDYNGNKFYQSYQDDILVSAREEVQ